MLHIHCRWIALLGFEDLYSLDLLASLSMTPSGEDKTDHGLVSFLLTHNLSSHASETWIPGASGQQHVVAIYRQSLQLPLAQMDSGLLIGVASPEPSDTSHTINQISSQLAAGSRATQLHADLSCSALATLPDALVDSVSFTVGDSSRIERFPTPLPANELAEVIGDTIPSGVTLLLGSERLVVNLFPDGQFYVADPSHRSVADVAAEVSQLWRPIGYPQGEAE